VLLEEATLPKVYFQILLSKIYLSWQRQRPSSNNVLFYLSGDTVSKLPKEAGITTLLHIF
jgi:hypothetical protein